MNNRNKLLQRIAYLNIVVWGAVAYFIVIASLFFDCEWSVFTVCLYMSPFPIAMLSLLLGVRQIHYRFKLSGLSLFKWSLCSPVLFYVLGFIYFQSNFFWGVGESIFYQISPMITLVLGLFVTPIFLTLIFPYYTFMLVRLVGTIFQKDLQ